ncbi:unnamed protein product [Phytophthora lilii]|uniref:Unnamed protein product n=1 Tax=Phytophthora lilii TaxID=2077276 RepID=A0A9W6WUG4_9STRA|nr:unnamed protein product [Phytophthora lilii]
MNVRDLREDLETSRKRAKLATPPASEKDTAGVVASVYSAGGMMMLRSSGAGPHADGAGVGVDGLASHMLYQDATMAAQWQTVFFNKLVRAKHLEERKRCWKEVLTCLFATVLCLLGGGHWRRRQRHGICGDAALAFGSKRSANFHFNTKRIGRFPDPSEGEEPPRGVMLPVLGSFRTQKDVVEWCSSIATKYQRVDFLINFAGPEVIKAIAETLKPEHSSDDSPKSEPIVSSAYEQFGFLVGFFRMADL